MMVLLLQLYADLPGAFPSHDRRLYIFSCKRRTCRRKEGSIRAVRGVRVSPTLAKANASVSQEEGPILNERHTSTSQDLGNSLFSKKSLPSSVKSLNPFSTSSTENSNPFAPGPLSRSSDASAMPPSLLYPSPLDPSQISRTEDLPVNFAQKARVSSPPASPPLDLRDAWPQDTLLLPAYPSYNLNADYEILEATLHSSTPNQAMDIEPLGGALSTSKDDTDAFESTIDNTFQRFADRLAQNPMQVLRYEFRGKPLMYSKKDAIGRLLASRHTAASHGNSRVTTMSVAGNSDVPYCPNCNASRAFELQLTPQAIVELEVDETGLEGMEWGTILLGVCNEDCQAKGVDDGEVGYLEEWVGVQWEESDSSKK